MLSRDWTSVRSNLCWNDCNCSLDFKATKSADLERNFSKRERYEMASSDHSYIPTESERFSKCSFLSWREMPPRISQWRRDFKKEFIARFDGSSWSRRERIIAPPCNVSIPTHTFSLLTILEGQFKLTDVKEQQNQELSGGTTPSSTPMQPLPFQARKDCWVKSESEEIRGMTFCTQGLG